MAIVKMKFVSACTDQTHLDDMIEASIHSKMLSSVPAVDIVNDDNNGKLLNDDNPYTGYLQTLQNIAHGIGFEFDAQSTTKTYTKEEVEEKIKTLQTAFGLNQDLSTSELSIDDETAIDALRACDFEEMHECRYLDFGLGRLPVDSFKKLNMYRDEPFVHHRLHQTSAYVWLIYITSDSYADKTKRIFDSLYFEPIEIPDFDVKKRVEQYKDELNSLYAFCKKKNALLNVYPYIAVLDTKYVLSGFVKANEVDAYEECFKDLPVDFRVKEPSKVPHLKCPTLLKNGWFARPFEMFVEMYSLPAYDDFDPTLFMAITYCILFGIMFGDMGQGLVLLVLGLILEKKKGRLWGIVARCGITSSIFGFLFGSVFGFEDALNPLHQSLFHVREKLFDVMADSSTMMLLIGAMAIGAVLILITMIMNMYNNAKHKRYGEVLFSQNGVAGFVFYTFLIVAMGGKLSGHDVYFTKQYTIPFMVLPMLCFLLENPLQRLVEGKGFKPEHGWNGYFTESIFEVFEILLSFVTNSMSYLRVGGFVLSHAGMMLVVMTLAEMTSGAGWFIVIFGNAFVMLLEGLIVGIQTLRLEYYEMFSRYYTGGGLKYSVMSPECVQAM